MELHIPETSKKRVVIIGGGFGGMNVINKLDKKKFQIVLIDKHNYHTFQPLLYQVAMGGLEPDSIAYPLRKFAKDHGDNVFFRYCHVEEILPHENLINTDKGNLKYDYLIVATGSQTNFFGNEDLENHALQMKTVPHSLDLRSLILENLEAALMTKDKAKRKRLLNFVIVGGGPTGVELTGALCELKKFVYRKEYHDLDIDEMSIYLLEGLDRLLNGMSEDAANKTQRFLEKMGAKIYLQTMVDKYDGERVKIGEDEYIETHNLIWTAGVKGSVPSGFPEDSLVKGNRLKVNSYCQVPGFENCFAIGDIAGMLSDERPKGHPMLAQVAIQMGQLVAKNLNRQTLGKNRKEFSYKNKGVLATIGRRKAVADLPNWKTQGIMAWYIWLFVHITFLVGFQNKVVVLFNWLVGYISYDSPLRLIIRPFRKINNDR